MCADDFWISLCILLIEKEQRSAHMILCFYLWHISYEMYQTWYCAVEGKWDESWSAKFLHCWHQSSPCVFWRCISHQHCFVFYPTFVASVHAIKLALCAISICTWTWCCNSFERPCCTCTGTKGKVSLSCSRANAESSNSSFLHHVILQMSTFYTYLSFSFWTFLHTDLGLQGIQHKTHWHSVADR